MSDFATTASLTVSVSEQSLKSAEQTIADRLGDVTVSVDGGAAMPGPLGGPAPTAGTTASEPQDVSGILTASLEVQEAQLSKLDDLVDDGGLLGGGGGGGIIGTILGGSGEFLGETAGEATGATALSGAATALSGSATALSGAAVALSGSAAAGGLESVLGGGGGDASVSIDDSDTPLSLAKPGWVPLQVSDPSPLGVDEPTLSVSDPSPLGVETPTLGVATPTLDVETPTLNVEEAPPLPVANVNPLPVERVGPIPVTISVAEGSSDSGGGSTTTVDVPDEYQGPSFSESVEKTTKFGAGAGFGVGAGVGSAAGGVGAVPGAVIGTVGGGILGATAGTVGYVGSRGSYAVRKRLNGGGDSTSGQQSGSGTPNVAGQIVSEYGYVSGGRARPPPTRPTGRGDINIQNTSRVDVNLDPSGLREIDRAIEEVRDAHEDNIDELDKELEDVKRRLGNIESSLGRS